MKQTTGREIKFSIKIAKGIADKQFGHTLDCVMGYSDSGYSLQDSPDEFEQNFAEDLEEKGLVVNNRRLQAIACQYKNMVEKFEKMVRNKYYK